MTTPLATIRADKETRRVRFGFKGRKQLPLFMVWEEFWQHGEVVDARVLFNSMRWIGV